MDVGQPKGADRRIPLERQAMRRALIVGIDDYVGCPLYGCVQDAERMETVLSRHDNGTTNFDCRKLTCPPDNLSRADLREAVSDLFAQPADIAWFHFSGHGTSNDLGGYLVTPDAQEHDVGVPMIDVLTMANDSPVPEVLITLDCCHSGTFGSVPSLKGNQVALAEGVSVVTATRAAQASLEVGGGGVFTSLLVEALEGGAAGVQGDITVAGVYAYIDSALGAWDQRPLFKTNISRLIPLRKARTKISTALLSRIVDHFPVPAEDFPLDPSYEPTMDPRNEGNEQVFRDLQELRVAGLVEPVDEQHMYYAAINSKACRLTKGGLYYWRLVNDGRL